MHFISTSVLDGHACIRTFSLSLDKPFRFPHVSNNRNSFEHGPSFNLLPTFSLLELLSVRAFILFLLSDYYYRTIDVLFKE